MDGTNCPAESDAVSSPSVRSHRCVGVAQTLRRNFEMFRVVSRQPPYRSRSWKAGASSSLTSGFRRKRFTSAGLNPLSVSTRTGWFSISAKVRTPYVVRNCSPGAKQSMHSSGSITRIRSNSWMQSTGQTSTQDRSLMSMQGSAMM